MADHQGRRAFVAGHPIKHSRSPLIHGYWLRAHGLDGSYEKQDVAPRDFAAFIKALRDGTSGFVGGNVTIPHKEDAFRLADRCDAKAQELGAANTLWREDGAVLAGNTDGYGFLANLDDATPGWSEKGGTAVVFGAGGASRAVIQAVRDRGFGEIHVVNRTVERALALADHFGLAVHAHGIAAMDEVLAGATLFVNTTAAGMDGEPVPAIDFSRMAGDGLVTDIVYTPLVTPLLLMAEAQGMRTADGLGMLLHQAVPGFEIWFGVRPEVTPELRGLVVADLEASA